MRQYRAIWGLFHITRPCFRLPLALLKLFYDERLSFFSTQCGGDILVTLLHQTGIISLSIYLPCLTYLPPVPYRAVWIGRRRPARPRLCLASVAAIPDTAQGVYFGVRSPLARKNRFFRKWQYANTQEYGKIEGRMGTELVKHGMFKHGTSGFFPEGACNYRDRGK